ncbi:venom protease-like isoform X2 [Aphidius gifuensis]|nr:venom protease-like isoform X2 [Aphidius gifuensis]
MQLLRTHGNTVGQFLRSSVCGFENRDPKVCCPIVSNDYDDGNNNNNNNNNNRPPIQEYEEPTPVVTKPPLRQIPQSSYGPLFSPQCGIVNGTMYPKVVNGVPAKLGDWPWVVALGYRSQKNPNRPLWKCGGSLISSRHVLTAGHCIYQRRDLYIIRLGDLDLNDEINDGASPVDILIEKADIHPQYSSTQFTNDIGIIKLQQDVQFTPLIQPICLPFPEQFQTYNYVNTRPFIAGWGSVYFRGPSATHLQYTQLPVRDTAECKQILARFKTVIDDRVICAGWVDGGQDACQGDSGGPLMFPHNFVYYAIGVVSYGYKCAEKDTPAVYTRTSAFLDWIAAHLN